MFHLSPIKLLCLATLLTLCNGVVLNTQEPADPNYKPVGTLWSVSSPDIDSADNVVLKSGYTYRLMTSFSAGCDSPNITKEVIVYIGETPIQYNDIESDCCKELTYGSCPCEEGEYYEHETSITIPESTPKIPVTFQWGMKTPDGIYQICYRMSVTIK